MADALPPRYHGDGPIFPGESWHQALGENTAASLTAHMAKWSPQHLRNGYYDDLGDGEPGGSREPSHDITQDDGGLHAEPGSYGHAMPSSRPYDPEEAGRSDPSDLFDRHNPYEIKKDAPQRSLRSRGSAAPPSGRPRRRPGRSSRP
jgi:hypothetical protein